MKLSLLSFSLFLATVPLAAQATIGGCQIFPRNNIWNTPVDKLPVDPSSDTYVATIGPTRSLHPDWSTTGSMPFNIVPQTQPNVPVILVSDESDPGPYPIPDAPVLEPPSDSHLLILQKGYCKLYEMYATTKLTGGGWYAELGAVFPLYTNTLRPVTWSSADAAGLPILPGLVRYDEVLAGEIRHAVRFTAPQTRRAYVWPARHYASTLTALNYPPMGQRFRLKASVDISRYSAQAQVILRALKRYGMMLSDNGGAWFITGAPDPRWSDVLINELKQIKGADFEAVNVSSLMMSANSGAVRSFQQNPVKP